MAISNSTHAIGAIGEFAIGEFTLVSSLAFITAVMAATETNSDVALFAINCYTGGGVTIPGNGAQVSLEEIQIPGNSKVGNQGN